jgi:hypothetical protein
MTLEAFLALIPAILQFPSQIAWFIQLLKKTPEEQHQALMDKIQSEADAYQKTGRPNG